MWALWILLGIVIGLAIAIAAITIYVWKNPIFSKEPW